MTAPRGAGGRVNKGHNRDALGGESVCQEIRCLLWACRRRERLRLGSVEGLPAGNGALDRLEQKARTSTQREKGSA